MSTYHFVCRTPGQLPSGYRRENLNNRFHGGTIYNDATSRLIWVENQVLQFPDQSLFLDLRVNNSESELITLNQS